MQGLPSRIAAGWLGLSLALGWAITPAWGGPTARLAQSPDDPPKPERTSRRGVPTGEIHGGAGGSDFRDKAWGRLTRVTVHAGAVVDAIRCTWDDGVEREEGPNHGGAGGQETVVTLEPGEAIVAVSGVVVGEGASARVGALTLQTNRRTIGPLGQARRGQQFTLKAPDGQEVCGFRGRSGATLDAIGVVCRPLP